jgi:hypothetical protein
MQPVCRARSELGNQETLWEARHTSGDTAHMAEGLLEDFRLGYWGGIALESPG